MSVHLDEARPRLADERQALAGVPAPQHRRTTGERSDDRPSETVDPFVPDPNWAPPPADLFHDRSTTWLVAGEGADRQDVVASSPTPLVAGSPGSPRRRSALAAAAVGACLAVIAGVLVLSGADDGDGQVITEGTTSSTAPIEPVRGTVPVTTAEVIGEQPVTESSADSAATTDQDEYRRDRRDRKRCGVAHDDP